MIDFDKLKSRVAGWGAMRYFPRTDSAVDVAARLEIVKAVASMAGTWERAVWIVDQMLALTSDWPGIQEVRGVFCQRYKLVPSGIEVACARAAWATSASLLPWWSSLAPFRNRSL